MKVVLISDIHIQGAEDPLYRSLLNLIGREVGPEDVLVLAGDIFDFFVGKQPVLLKRYAEFFRIVGEKLREGARVEYIEGNHDFHLRSAFDSLFPNSPNLKIRDADVSIETPRGKKLYVAHGDLVDREDRGYLRLRAFFRSPFIRFAAFALPGKIVEKIGAHSNDASKKKNPRLPEEKGEDVLQNIRRKFRRFAESKFHEGYDGIVMGHCHDLDGADFIEGGRRGKYLNVGFPRVHRTYVVFSDAGTLERKTLP